MRGSETTGFKVLDCVLPKAVVGNISGVLRFCWSALLPLEACVDGPVELP